MRHGGELASEEAGAEAKIRRPHRASWEFSVDGRPGLWLFCPPDSPQGHVHHPGHLAVPLTWGFPPAPRFSLPEDATALNRAQNAWLRPEAQNSTFSGTAGDPGACWRRGGCDRSKWGWEGAEPHRAEPSEAGSVPRAMRKLRSLLPWTSVGKTFWGWHLWEIIEWQWEAFFSVLGDTWKCSPFGIFSPWNYSTNSRTTSGNISRPGANYTATAHQSSRVRASPFWVFFF